MPHPPSTVDLCGFPHLNIAPPIYEKVEVEPFYVEDSLVQGDQIVQLKCTVSNIGLSGVSDVSPKLFRLDQYATDSVMADTIANSCIADSKLHLVNY